MTRREPDLSRSRIFYQLPGTVAMLGAMGLSAVIDLQVKIGLVAVVFVAAIGFISIWRALRSLVDDEAFAKGFHSRFTGYMNSRCSDQQAYNWLITNSPRMQSKMGGYGLVHAFRPAYEQVIYQNWPIILNAIPIIRAVADSPHLVNNYAHMVNDALMRYLGSLDEIARACRAEVRNPVIWLREGGRALIASPLHLLSWFGILGSATVSGVTASHTFKALSGIVTVAGFVALISGLIVDTPQAWSAICSWWGL